MHAYALAFVSTFATLGLPWLGTETSSDWRISPEEIHITVGEDRRLQVLDDLSRELHGAIWSIDDPRLAEIHEDGDRAVLSAKAPGAARVSASWHGEIRFLEIDIAPAQPPQPQGTKRWSTHAIGRDLGDIPAVPTPDGINLLMLEQTADDATWLRGIEEDGIQAWSWQLPEKTHDVELICGDWLGGALLGANRRDSYTLYTVGKDGKLRWQHTFAGRRKSQAYNLQHLVHVLTQSADGLSAHITAIDSATGEVRFDLPIPASHEQVRHVQRNTARILCVNNSSEADTRVMLSRLFVNIDGFAYLAFTENQWTLSSDGCRPGSTVATQDVSFGRDEAIILWQIHPDGTYRPTVIEQTKRVRPLSDPISVASPTGGLIPDGLGGVLVSVRLTHDDLVHGVHGPLDEFVYRLDEDGNVAYKLPLPRSDGPLEDEMVLGENDRGFATRGAILVAFDVRNGKELWRWNASTSGIKVFAALANGGCLVQTPAALVEVDGPDESHEVLHGQAIVDWLGNIYRKGE